MRHASPAPLSLVALLAVPLVAGCGVGASAPRAVAEPEPAYRQVHFVGKVPPPKEYRCVGKVTGVAPREDFVSAAHDARVDIKTKAANLGARVVKIDRVRVPSSKARPSSKPTVLLTGRAYRPVEPRPVSAGARHRRARGRSTPTASRVGPVSG